MNKLATQLRWSQFVNVLKHLHYKQLDSKGGAARHFERPDGQICTFHEPHGGGTLPQGTLREYLRKLKLSREDFEVALLGQSENSAVENEQYRRCFDSDGTIISNCLKCLELVGRFSSDEEASAAESSHPCWLLPADESMPVV